MNKNMSSLHIYKQSIMDAGKMTKLCRFLLYQVKSFIVPVSEKESL